MSTKMTDHVGQGSENHAYDSVQRLLKTEKLREEIRALLRFHHRPFEIYEKLNISRSEYYRHLKAIRKEDQKYILELRGSDFASSVRQCIETLQDCSRQCALIIQDAEKDSDRIAAIELRYQIELDILNVEKVGPSAVAIGTRLERVRNLQDGFIQN